MTAQRRRSAWGIVAALFVGILGVLAASCGGDDGPGTGEAHLVTNGAVTVTTAAGETEVVTDSVTLAFGDVVVVDDGTATLELAAGQTYEFRSGVVDSEVLVGAPPTLRRGDGLVTGGFPAAIAYETTTVSAQGALKVSSEVPSATSYVGGARISGAGALEQLPALREVVLTASAEPNPLEYDATDPWDRQHLGEAIAFGQRLEALARGYTNDLQPGARPETFYEAVLPPLGAEREFSDDLLDDRPTGETLVGAAITIQGRDGTFRERWRETFAFRDEGAAWGLVALDQGVSSAPVLDSIELAITDSPPPDEPPPPPSTAPSTTGSTSTTPDPPPTQSPPTSPPTTEEPAPPEDGSILEPVLKPVDDILGSVLDALGLGAADD